MVHQTSFYPMQFFGGPLDGRIVGVFGLPKYFDVPGRREVASVLTADDFPITRSLVCHRYRLQDRGYDHPDHPAKPKTVHLVYHYVGMDDGSTTE
jgi:hypothetical protein